MAEAWKPVIGYEGFYEVSSEGRVRGLSRKIPHGLGDAFRHVKGKVLAAKPGNHGYPSVMLSREGKKKLCTVHRLVMHAFVGSCPDGFEVAHSDGNRLNCRLQNLRYATRKENVADSIAHGTAPIGFNNGAAKLTPKQVKEIRQSNRTLREIANDYSISPVTAWNAKVGRTYKP